MSFSFFFFKQKTEYEMRISDWSSDVCASDLKRSDSNGGSKYRQIQLTSFFPPADARPADAPTAPDGHQRHQEQQQNDEYDRGVKPEQKSAERRVGTECDSTWRSQWATYLENKPTRRTAATAQTAKPEI